MISVQRSEKPLVMDWHFCLPLAMCIVSYSIVKLLLSTVSFVLAILLTNLIDTTNWSQPNF